MKPRILIRAQNGYWAVLVDGTVRAVLFTLREAFKTARLWHVVITNRTL